MLLFGDMLITQVRGECKDCVNNIRCGQQLCSQVKVRSDSRVRGSPLGQAGVWAGIWAAQKEGAAAFRVQLGELLKPGVQTHSLTVSEESRVACHLEHFGQVPRTKVTNCSQEGVSSHMEAERDLIRALLSKVTTESQRAEINISLEGSPR